MDAQQRQGEAMPEPGRKSSQESSYPPPPSSSIPAPAPSLTDALFAIALFVLGFLFWEWGVLWQDYAGIGETLFFLIVIAATALSMQLKGIRQNWRSVCVGAIALLGALPFVLYGARDFNILIWLFEVGACLAWVMYACRTSITASLSGFLFFDALNQSLIIPFANFGRALASLTRGLLDRKRRCVAAILLVLASLVICLPLFIVVLNLLAASDEGFAGLLQDMGQVFAQLDLGQAFTWGIELIFGIPVACYIFGVVYGNVQRRRSDTLSRASLESAFENAHSIPQLAFCVPLGLLVVIYTIYCVVVGGSLLEAFGSGLPASYTYAHYAREGFFELCGVATIDLLVMGVVYLLARRKLRVYPLPLRIMTAALALLTCLLVITAALKMLLYISVYGLTPLRLYTSVFMLSLFVIFVLLLIWHLRPFNAARPMILLVAALFLALSLSNTDGLIARFNVDRYLSGATTTMDVALLSDLSDAALPALRDLRDEATDPTIIQQAAAAISAYGSPDDAMFADPAERDRWYNWNLMTLERGSD